MSIPWTSRYCAHIPMGFFLFSHSGRLGAKLCCTVSPCSTDPKDGSVLRPGEKCRIFPTEKPSIYVVCWLNKPTKKKMGLLVDLVVDLGEKADWTLTHAYNLAEASNSKLSSSIVFLLILFVNLGLSMVSPFNFSNQSVEAKHPSKRKNRLRQQDFSVGGCG